MTDFSLHFGFERSYSASLSTVLPELVVSNNHGTRSFSCLAVWRQKELDTTKETIYRASPTPSRGGTSSAATFRILDDPAYIQNTGNR